MDPLDIVAVVLQAGEAEQEEEEEQEEKKTPQVATPNTLQVHKVPRPRAKVQVNILQALCGPCISHRSLWPLRERQEGCSHLGFTHLGFFG